ncbi:PTS sugar transporter subunit IIA [Sporolactobacillus vineae]|uniref:PTS sugar transporter subunit IIA n=1 Tax=Sporolactobacillus vineae TaxID=444463 RepID=UPI000287C291|nr:PTS fructose subfamily transporter subunit IIA [Sporolactobacillus vineae]
MIAILLVTHGHFGAELLKSAELIAGQQEDVETISLNKEDSIQEFGDVVRQKIASLLSHRNKLLVLTDLFGGSPSNVTAANLKSMGFKCLSGVNLPMLLEALILRNGTDDLDQLSSKVMKSGVDGIKDINQILLKSK